MYSTDARDNVRSVLRNRVWRRVNLIVELVIQLIFSNQPFNSFRRVSVRSYGTLTCRFCWGEVRRIWGGRWSEFPRARRACCPSSASTARPSTPVDSRRLRRRRLHPLATRATSQCSWLFNTQTHTHNVIIIIIIIVVVIIVNVNIISLWLCVCKREMRVWSSVSYK